MIISPQTTVVSEIARLATGKFGVIVSLPVMNDDFRKIVKQSGYVWDSNARHWYRRLDEYSGPITDCLLEMAHTLFNSGFAISLDNDELIERLKKGDWQPEHKRWVIVAEDRLGLRWRGENNENLYQKAQMLPDN